MEIEGKKVVNIVECWKDEYNTLFQCIMYRPEDEHKPNVNPNLTKLVYRYYFDNEHNLIKKDTDY